LMEQLFRQSDLETRFGINMNVLDANGMPRVMDLRDMLQAYLDHRQVVLQRRGKNRLAEIIRRLELLEGYLIAYLNLDEVIRIIRTEDEPKPKLMKKFSLTDNQAEAILNMRLRSLRKLEEMEIRTEHKSLSAERKELNALLKDEGLQWKAIAEQVKDVKKQFGGNTPLGRRRTALAEAPTAVIVPLESMIEKEPVTVVLSAKGWIRAMKGHRDDVLNGGDLKFKEGDSFRVASKAMSTDKVLLAGSDGRFYSIGIDRLPMGRGLGEPIRLMIDLPNDADIIHMTVYAREQKFLVVSSAGRGFVVRAEDAFAQTKNGKLVLNLSEGEKAVVCTPIPGTSGLGTDLLTGKPADSVAIIGDTKTLLIFPLKEVPEMSRGRGVILQRYKDGGTADAKVFTLKEGLTWRSGDRERTETDIKDWVGERAQAGRLPPRGFSREDRPFSG
jgi:topoisomerase-4 subunit A